MDFSLTDDQLSLRDQIYRFAQAELNEGVRERDAAHEFPHDLWLKCGEMAIQGLPIPVEYGGAGLDAQSTALALESFGHGCEDGGLVFAICAHMLACAIPISLNGTESQKRKYLPKLSNGSFIAVNAITEPDSGSDAFSMKTQAVAEGEDFILTGAKTFSSNSPLADLAVVYASTDQDKGFLGGITAFLVEKDAAGFSTGQTFEKMGLRTCPIGELVFDEVRVGQDAVLGSVGDGGAIFAQSMEWERTCLAAVHVGEMERLLGRAVDYAKNRKAFGRQIGEFQAISHKIADLKVRLEAARMLTYYAASQLDARHNVGLTSSIAKVFVSESLVRSALDTIQVLGGYGFTTEYDVERVLRDSVGSTIYSGTSEIQRNIIARWLGL